MNTATFAWVHTSHIFVTVFVLCLAGAELGFRLGRYLHAGADERTRSQIGTMQAAVLGMFGLLLGFSFAMTGSRYEVRKALVLEEANAIGTTWLRARLLPEPVAAEAAVALRRYVDLRLAWFDAGVDVEKLRQASEQAEQLLNRLWSTTAAAAAEDRRAVTTGLFVQSLNDVIDVNAKRQIALHDHVPVEIFGLLVFGAICSMVLTGYACGVTGSRNFLPSTLAARLIAAIIFCIVDLHRPRSGFIREPQRSLINLRDSMDRSAR
jgi:hypothetical protein